MSTSKSRAVRIALMVSVSATLAKPAAAQFIQATTIDPDSPVERLGSAIRILAGNPRNMEALMSAGTAALDVGDANAALGFFSRAEEIAPSNGRAKAGLGAALANIEKPDDALRLFAQAASLGAPETAFARDRGLAYDLTGDWRRAQRDYQLAMRANARDDETVRRYALSLGISGNRAQALQVLDPLLRRQDQGAWRARAFIYAMTGDVGQANTVARQLMPAPMAASMSPLLARLATLNPAERAHAVNFGTVPADGTRLASADTSRALPPSALGGSAQPFVLQRAPTLADAESSRSTSPSSGLIPSGEPLGRRSPAPVPSSAQRAPAERPVQLAVRAPVPTFPIPGTAGLPTASPPRAVARREVARLDDPFAAASVSRRVGTRVGPVDPSRLPPEIRGDATPVTLVPAAALPLPIGREPTSSGALVSAPVETAPAAITATRPAALAIGRSAPSPAIDNRPAALVPATPTPLDRIPSATTSIPDRPGLIGPPVAQPLVPTVPATELPTVATVASSPAPGFTQPVLPTPGAVAGSTTSPSVVALPQAAPTNPGPQPPITTAVTRPARLAGLLDGIAVETESTAGELPSVRELRLAQAGVRRRIAEQTAQAEAKAEDERLALVAAAKAASDARRNPARLWVQVATGANEAGLPLTWRRIRDGNPSTLDDMTAYSVPYKATNRLLVGPVKSAAEAREIIRALAGNGVAATTYSSDAGQEVVRVGGK